MPQKCFNYYGPSTNLGLFVSCKIAYGSMFVYLQKLFNPNTQQSGLIIPYTRVQNEVTVQCTELLLKPYTCFSLSLMLTILFQYSHLSLNLTFLLFFLIPYLLPPYSYSFSCFCSYSYFHPISYFYSSLLLFLILQIFLLLLKALLLLIAQSQCCALNP